LIIQKLLNSLSTKNKRLLLLACIYFIIPEGLLISFSFTGTQTKNANVIVNDHFDRLIESIDSLEKCVANNKPLSQKQHYYTLSRKNYKYIEGVVEYVTPFFAKYYINGPPIKKHDIENGNKVFEPHGFQLLESVFFLPKRIYQMRL
jgi:hypothetical protein